VTLIDTAEMYPVPPKADTQGRTEQYIGTWLAQHRAQRARIVLATKIAGRRGSRTTRVTFAAKAISSTARI
jgi:aryl-alcohol dehydrogenase-like predicted oxidoreductase